MYMNSECTSAWTQWLVFFLARYCCLFCHTSRQEMKLPPSEREQPTTSRTLDTLQNDYQAYMTDGSRKARAKDVSHSVVAEHMIGVDINHVSLKFINTHVIYIYIF